MKKFFNQGVLILLFAFLGIVSFVVAFADTQNTGDLYSFSTTFQVDRSLEFIEEYGQYPHPRGSEEHERVRLGIIGAIEETSFTPIEMNYSFTYEDALLVGSYNADNVLVTPTEVQNILVFIDSPTSTDSVMFLAHYDSVPMGPGASDDLYGIAAMLETIRQIDEGSFTLTNDVIFLFSDGEEEGLIGALKFATKATPINQVDSTYVNLVDDVRFLVNHESRGTGGTLIMFETTPGNYYTVEQFAAINKDIVTNSVANFIYRSMPNGTDYSAFSMLGIQGINVANVGEGYFYHTQGDNIAGVDKSLLAQHGALETSVLNHFGTYDLSLLYEASGDAVFFNYLNFGTYVYSETIAYLLIGLALFLLALHQWLLHKNETKVDVFKGLFVVVIALVVSVASVMALTALSQWVPDLNVRLTTSSYSSPALLFMALTFAMAFALIVIMIFHQWIKVTPKGIVLANTYLFALVSIALTILQFEISYLFTLPTLVASLLWVIQVLTSKWIKVDLVPLTTFAFLPLAMQLLVLAADALGAKMYAYIAILSFLTFGFVVPYIISLPRKKWVLSGYAVATVFLITSIVLGTSEYVSPAGDGLSVNLTGKASGRTILFTDDSLIFEINKDINVSQWVIPDKDAYRYMEEDLDSQGFSYQEATLAYVYDNSDVVTLPSNSPLLVDNTDSSYYEINVTRYYYESFFVLSLPSQGVTKVEIAENGSLTTFTDFSAMTDTIYYKGYYSASIKVYTTAFPSDFVYEEFFQFDDQLMEFSWVENLVENYPSLRVSTYIKETISIE